LESTDPKPYLGANVGHFAVTNDCVVEQMQAGPALLQSWLLPLLGSDADMEIVGQASD